MSIKGTSVEVIVVLVVFPPPLYMSDRNICWYDRDIDWSAFYLLPYTGRIALNVVREMDLNNQ